MGTPLLVKLNLLEPGSGVGFWLNGRGIVGVWEVARYPMHKIPTINSFGMSHA